MTARRNALAALAIGLLAALFPISAAFAGELQTCALGDACVEVPVHDDVADAVDGTTGATSEAVDKTKEAADKATGGWSEPVTDPVVDGINETLDLTPSLKEGAGKGKKKRDRNGTGSKAGSGSSFVNEQAAAAAAYERSFDALAAREARRLLDGRLDQAVSFIPPAEPPLGERLARAALEAAKAFTFPAILIGLVVGFVLVQNRIDHRDPKLAFAPVSSEQEYVSFT